MAILAEALRLDPNHASALTFAALLPARRRPPRHSIYIARDRVDPRRARHTICAGSRSGRRTRRRALVDLRQAVALDASLSTPGWISARC
jgi:hypothetical protein